MMNLGDRVEMIGCIDENGDIIGTYFSGKKGVIIAEGTLYPWIVKFDKPVKVEEGKYWEEMPCYEKEFIKIGD